ncbi:MAG: hypothetical protein K6E91_05620 [Butyrivibrio sp.]|nr:hypothetical protein [Butyrivibrio sp.]
MKRLLAIALCSVIVAVSPVSAIAAEPGGSNSITAEDIKEIKDKLDTISGDVKELVNLVKAQDPSVVINNNPTITNNPTNNNTNSPTTTNYNDNNVGGNTIGGNTITNNNNSSSDTTVTNTSSSESGGGAVPVPVPVPVPPAPPIPGGGGNGGGGGGSSSGSSANCVVYNGCCVYACKKIVINGCKSNATFMVNGVSGGTASSASDLAKKVGGSLVCCCETSAPGVVFSTAKVNFFVNGVLDGDNVAVYQLQNGKWVQLSVSEIRKDHVVVNMSKHGPLAFIRVPALATIG